MRFASSKCIPTQLPSTFSCLLFCLTWFSEPNPSNLPRSRYAEFLATSKARQGDTLVRIVLTSVVKCEITGGWCPVMQIVVSCTCTDGEICRIRNWRSDCVLRDFRSDRKHAPLTLSYVRALLPLSHALVIFPSLFSLQNFPLLKRLKTLLLSNNLIFRIGDDLKESLPNVHTIMLANNSLLNIRDLKPFASLPSLRRLCLIENNVTKQVRLLCGSRHSL